MPVTNNIDNSIANPGPMGWGVPTDTIAETQYKEQAIFSQLAETHPRMLIPRAPRLPSVFMETKIRKLMEEDGIIEGWACHYIEKAVFGSFQEWLAQRIGSCVASGGGRVDTWAILQERFLLNEPEEILGTKLTGTDNISPFLPFSYRAGRKFAGINGNGDGSYCSAHLRGKKEYGILPCSAPGLVSNAFPEPQDDQLYRKWGADDTLLNKFAPLASPFKLQETGLIESGDAGKIVVADKKKPTQICSDWAFRPDFQHPTWKLADGTPVWIYKRDTSTSWAHNMSVAAIVKIDSGEWFVIIINSWDKNAHKNGSWFVIPFSVYSTWCRDSEQMYIGDFQLTDSEIAA